MQAAAGPRMEPPPVLDFTPRSSFKFRKNTIYNCLLAFIVWTNFTHRANALVHPEYWASRLSGEQSRRSWETNPDTPGSEPQPEPQPGTEPKTQHYQYNSLDDINFGDSEDVRPFVPPTEMDGFLENGNMTRNEYNRARGLAQDMFFSLSEANFYESGWDTFLKQWSIDARPRYEAVKLKRPGLTILEFFPEDLMGWKGMKCSIEYNKGCINVPSLEHIRNYFPQERHHARRINFSLHAIRLGQKNTSLVKTVLDIARTRMKGHCHDFAYTFFHGKTRYPKKMCATAIINIVLGVIMAIVAVMSLGSLVASLVGIVVETVVQATLIGSGSALASGFITTVTSVPHESTSSASTSFLKSTVKGVTEFAGAEVSKILSVTEQMKGVGNSIKNGFSSLEHFVPSSALADIATTDGGSDISTAPWASLISKWFKNIPNRVSEWFKKLARGENRQSPTDPWYQYDDDTWLDSQLERQFRNPRFRNPRYRPTLDTIPENGLLELPDTSTDYGDSILSLDSGSSDEKPSWVRTLVENIKQYPEKAKALWKNLFKSISGDGIADEVISVIDDVTSTGGRSRSIASSPSVESDDGSIDASPGQVNHVVEATVTKLQELVEGGYFAEAASPGSEEVAPEGSGHFTPPLARRNAHRILTRLAQSLDKENGLRIADEADNILSPPLNASLESRAETKNTALENVVEVTIKELLQNKTVKDVEATIEELQQRVAINKAREAEWVSREGALPGSAGKHDNLQPRANTTRPFSITGNNTKKPFAITGDIIAIGSAGIMGSSSVNTSQCVTWVESEYVNAKDLQELSPESGDGRSLYDLVDIKHNGTFVINPYEAMAMHVRSRNLTTADAWDVHYRSEAVFTIYSADHDVKFQKEMPSGFDHGKQLISRLQNDDGTPMDIHEVMLFMRRMGPTIQDLYHQLRKPEEQFRATNIPLPKAPSNPKIKVKTHPQRIGWESVLGGIKFDGVRSKDGAGEMTFSANVVSNGMEGAGMKKRGEGAKANAYHAYVHHLTGVASLLEGMNLARPSATGQLKKRFDDDAIWKIENDGNTYSFTAERAYFGNDIKQPECGTPFYTGDVSMNKDGCEAVIDDSINAIFVKLDRAASNLNNNRDWRQGDSAPFAKILGKQFFSYASFRTVALLESNTKPFEEKATEQLKNCLVAKAYGDQNCLVKCTSVSNLKHMHDANQDAPVHSIDGWYCRSGCYDPTQEKFESLYGFSDKKRITGEMEPWNLNETLITEASYRSYAARSPGYMQTGLFNLDPFSENVKDNTPILPVCRSEWISISPMKTHDRGMSNLPCTCGNKYGNETIAIWSNGDWNGRVIKDNESKAMAQCLRDDRLLSMATEAPGAYLVNVCNLYYKAIAPEATLSKVVMGNEGKYQENARMCRLIVSFYEDHKHETDGFLDENLCKIWAANAKDMHHNHDHDWSHVNSIVKKHGCKPYRKN